MEDNKQPLDLQLKQTLPNASAVLVLGILSIVFCWCFGFGLIMGIIALALSMNAHKLYRENPDKWIGYGNLQAGKITAIIGVSLSAVYVIFVIIGLITEGWDMGYEFLGRI
jgi:hypothetical protein